MTIIWRRWSAERSGRAAGRSAGAGADLGGHAFDALRLAHERASNRLVTCLVGGKRGAFGQPQVDHAARAGSSRGRTAAGTCPCRRRRAPSDGQRQRDRLPAVLDAPGRRWRESARRTACRRARAWLVGCAAGLRLEQQRAEVGHEVAPRPATRSAAPTAVTAKIAKVYSPAVDCARPIGRKPAAVISVPVSIGIAVAS